MEMRSEMGRERMVTLNLKKKKFLKHNSNMGQAMRITYGTGSIVTKSVPLLFIIKH